MKSARGVAMRNNRKTIETVSVWLRLWIHSSRSSWFRLLFTRRKSWSDVCYLSEARDTVDESESNLLTQIFAWPGGQPTGARAAFLMKRNHRERGKRNGDHQRSRNATTESPWELCQGFIAKVSVRKRTIYLRFRVYRGWKSWSFGIYPSMRGVWLI